MHTRAEDMKPEKLMKPMDLEGERIVGLCWARGDGSTLFRKNVYPVLGKPLLFYALNSVKKSGLTRHFYVFTEDDEIASITESFGFKAIPRPENLIDYNHPNFSMEECWEKIGDFIKNDIGMVADPYPYAPEHIRVLQATGHFMLMVNCNNVMIRPSTYKKMYATLKANPHMYQIVPSVRIIGNLQITGPNGALLPLIWYPGVDRQHYPDVYRPLSTTTLSKMENVRDKGSDFMGCYPLEVDEVEGFDVHSLDDVRFVETFLRQHNDYFDF